MRLTDFWSRLEQAFGSAHVRGFAADQVFTELDERTINQALADGVPAVTVWRAVVAAHPDQVPSRLR